MDVNRGRLCGRTPNDIKNYWNTHIQKKYSCQRDDRDKLKTKKNINTKKFRPQPRTFKKNISVSTVKNLKIDNLVPPGDTSCNPSSVPSLVDQEKSWWDNLILNFENNNENKITLSFDNSIEEPMKDNLINEEVGNSRFGISDNVSLDQEGQVSDWANIFTKNIMLIGTFSMMNKFSCNVFQ